MKKLRKEKEMASLLLLLLLGLSLVTRNAIGGEYRIANSSDFIKFVDDINNGVSTYSGTTVFLEADLFLSGEALDPIGVNSSNQFTGVFDGQGHVISDLKINSTNQHAGLFGYSSRLTVRNVVLDSSCSITSLSTSGNAYIGGIIGGCSTSESSCSIVSIVNMAPVTFSGEVSCTNCNLHLGGIAGYLSASSSTYACTVKNCANYGSVMQSGDVKYFFIGGVVGFLYGYNRNYNYIQNCLNYGSIVSNGNPSYASYIGGISGYNVYSHVENCLSGGKISSNMSGKIGSLVGVVVSDTDTNYCYFTSDVGWGDLCGFGEISDTTGTSASSSPLDSSLVENLSNQTTKHGWDNWVLLHLNGGKINNLTREKLVVTGSHFPDPVKEGDSFLYWCEDANLSKKYNPDTSDLTKITALYARYGVEVNVTFEANGGSLSLTSITVTSNAPYGDLPTPNRTGFTFIGWFTEGNESITSESIVKIPNNHTLYAQWKEVPTKYVEIVFETKGLGEDKIIEIIEKYTDDDNFKIVKLENEREGTRVIIEFTDAGNAESFFEAARASSSIKAIKIIRSVDVQEPSFSNSLCPNLISEIIIL